MKQLILLIGFLAFVSFSCKKDKETNTNDSSEEMTAAGQNALASNMFDDIYKQVDYSAADAKTQCGGKFTYGQKATCATVTVGAGELDLTTWPKHITVDFGTTGCVGTDLRTRKGKLIYTATGWFHDVGTVITVTTDNYYVDSCKVEGTKTITTNARNSSNNLSWHVVVTNGIITHPSGVHHTWATDRTTEWIAGESTPIDFFDNKYSSIGSANGITSSGSAYSITIDNAHPLITQFGCRWIEQGILTLVVSSHPSITINYGDGNCDRYATVVINGVSYGFIMI